MEYVWTVTGEKWDGTVVCASSWVAYCYIEKLYIDKWKLWGKDKYGDDTILTDSLVKLLNVYTFDNDHFRVESRLGTIWAEKVPIVTTV